MKGGAENRRKTVLAGSLGAVAFCCLLYAYNTLFGGSSTPPPSIASTSPAPPPVRAAGSRAGANSASEPGAGQRSSAGVPAARLASASASLDPTLDDRAMVRTEHLLYSGSGRNIFSATYTALPAPVKLPTHVPPARPQPVVLPSGPTGPPPPPAINLKFFGTATRSGSTAKEAFLLSGEDVYVASAGEIVARKYKIVQIATSSVIVQDLQNGNTQTLPLLVR